MTKASIGLIGLGTMGSNLALNIADNGFDIAVFNRTVQRSVDFHASAGRLADRITPCLDLKALVAAINAPQRRSFGPMPLRPPRTSPNGA